MEPIPNCSSAPPALPSRRLRWIARALRGLLWLVASCWVLFGLSWLVLHGWIVPRIAEYRPRLEAQASRALGVPVRIGAISGRSVGAMPSFELRDVTLLDAQGREAVRLPHVLAALSPSSLWGLGFEQLVIEQPELDVRRTADGKILVAGLEVAQPGPAGSSSAAADWLFSQAELVVRGGTVRWTDERRGAPPLALRQVDAVLQNRGHRHLMRLDATPPADWGARFGLRGVFRRPLLSLRAGALADWSGQAYGDFPRVDVSRMQRHASLEPLGVTLNRGRGALRAWADVRKGELAGVLADVALQDVDARLGPALAPLAFASLSGRLGGSRDARGFEASTEGLQFVLRDGLRWPGGNVALVHGQAQRKRPAYTTLKADRLDLAALARIAARLPLEPGAQALLASLAPRGLVQSLDARWNGPPGAPSSFAARGRATGLGVAARPADGAAPGTPGRPGLSGATVDFSLTQDGGQASVQIDQGALELPGIFEDPRVPMAQLSAQAQWTLAGERIELQLRNLQFANADAQGQAEVRWRTDDHAAGPPEPGSPTDRRFPGLLELQGSLSRGEGGRVHRYLPLVLPQEARHYVRDAVVGGQVSDVRFKVAGPLAHLPFTQPAQGDFQVSARVRNGQLAYVPKALQPVGATPWPALTQLNGELLFSRASLEVKNASGRVAGLPGLQLVRGEARIANLMHEATVEVGLDVRGPLSDALGFVNASPVGQMTGQALAEAVAAGAADYRFRLVLPIQAIESSRVEGSVTLAGNDVQFAPGTPALGRIKGVVNITEQGFSVAGAHAQLLGGEARIDGAMRPPASSADRGAGVAFKAQGTATADGLRQAGLGLASSLAAHASGSAPYTASLLFRRGGLPELAVASSLQGLALDLPAPLAKAAEAALPLRFENALVPASLEPGQTLQDQLTVSLGRLASASYVRDVGGPAPRVLRGSIGVGLQPHEAAALPESGVGGSLSLERLDLDAWEKVLDEAAAGTAPAPPASAPAPAAEAAGLAPAMAYLPTVLALRAGELRLQGRSLNQVVLGASREGTTWRANIDARELGGYVEFGQPGGQGPGRVHARLSRLRLAASQAGEVEAMLEAPPASVPALDIVVESLELHGKPLGRVEVEAVNRLAPPAEGGRREWRLNKFNVALPEATLRATGHWAALAPGAGRRRAAMDFRLDVADSGALLSRLGMPGVIRRGKGRLEGQVAWLGSPLSLDYPSLNGQFHVNVESGQFMKAEPGMAKLLGVLSLQSLPRRLTLDFRDVFSQGFAFDFVRGDVTIDQGVAQTNNLQMSGVNAAVLMDGRAGLADETQSLRVVVVPEINAGTASLIATVINPAVGVGSFLAQMFLRRPLMEAATQEFEIEGTWSDPKITKIDRKARARALAGEPSVETR